MPEYSISQIGKFEECALQYKFIYVDGIKHYEEGVEAFLGQRFHEAMERLYRERAFRGSNRPGEARDGSLRNALRLITNPAQYSQVFCSGLAAQ